MTHSIFCLAAVSLLTACATEPQPPISLDTPDQPHSAADAVDVALESGIADRVEPLTMIRSGEARLRPERYRSGDVWKQVFVGEPGKAPATLRITSARLEASYTAFSNFMRYTYTADAIVLRDGVEHRFRSEGYSTSLSPTTSDVRDAVQGAVTSMAVQVNAPAR
jgi:hypothetical protein